MSEVETKTGVESELKARRLASSGDKVEQSPPLTMTAKPELETKTGEEIARESILGINVDIDKVIVKGSKHSLKRYVPLEAHEAALEKAEANKHFAFADGERKAKQEFLALLAEQRKEAEKKLKTFLSFEEAEFWKGRLELLVLLEERTK